MWSSANLLVRLHFNEGKQLPTKCQKMWKKRLLPNNLSTLSHDWCQCLSQPGDPHRKPEHAFCDALETWKTSWDYHCVHFQENYFEEMLAKFKSIKYLFTRKKVYFFFFFNFIFKDKSKNFDTILYSLFLYYETIWLDFR